MTLTSVCRRTCTGWGAWRWTWLSPGWTWHTGSCPPCPSWEGPENGPHLGNTNRWLNSTDIKKNGIFSLSLLLPSRENTEQRKKLKALLSSLCVIHGSSLLLSTSSGSDLAARLSKQKGITRCVFLLDTAKYIFVKSCYWAGKCQLFEVLFRRIHGENLFQVPLSLQKNGKGKWKRKSCHLRPVLFILKPLLANDHLNKLLTAASSSFSSFVSSCIDGAWGSQVWRREAAECFQSRSK